MFDVGLDPSRAKPSGCTLLTNFGKRNYTGRLLDRLNRRGWKHGMCFQLATNYTIPTLLYNQLMMFSDTFPLIIWHCSKWRAWSGETSLQLMLSGKLICLITPEFKWTGWVDDWISHIASIQLLLVSLYYIHRGETCWIFRDIMLSIVSWNSFYWSDLKKIKIRIERNASTSRYAKNVTPQKNNQCKWYIKD